MLLTTMEPVRNANNVRYTHRTPTQLHTRVSWLRCLALPVHNCVGNASDLEQTCVQCTHYVCECKWGLEARFCTLISYECTKHRLSYNRDFSLSFGCISRSSISILLLCGAFATCIDLYNHLYCSWSQKKSWINVISGLPRDSRDSTA